MTERQRGAPSHSAFDGSRQYPDSYREALNSLARKPTAHEVGKQVGIHHSTVYRHLKRIEEGKPLPPSYPDSYREALDSLAKRPTQETVGSQFGIHRSTVGKHFRRVIRAGEPLPPRRSRRSDIELDDIKKAVARGIEAHILYDVIAGELGLERPRVTQIVAELREEERLPRRVIEGVSLRKLGRRLDNPTDKERAIQLEVKEKILKGDSLISIARELKLSTGTTQNIQAILVILGEIDARHVRSKKRREHLTDLKRKRDALLAASQGSPETTIVSFTEHAEPTVVFPGSPNKDS